LVVLLFGALSAAYKKVVDFKLFKREKLQMPLKNSFLDGFYGLGMNCWLIVFKLRYVI